MKVLSYGVLLAILLLVAAVGLSPPTQKKDKQTVATVEQPSQAIEVRADATAPVSNNEKLIAVKFRDSGIANNIYGKNEVAARARNGSLKLPELRTSTPLLL